MTTNSQTLKKVPSGEDGTNQKNFVQVGILVESANDNLTANAGGGQTNALQLYNEVNRITTVATAGDSVQLPKAVAGMTIMVINHGANPMQVFGYGTDTIDDAVSSTGVSQMPNSVIIYICATAGAWYTEGLATGYYNASGVGQFQTFSSQTGVTAHAGGGQASAVQITAMQVQVSTVATSGDSIKLPPSQPGLQIDIVNNGANSMNVFPATGETINGGSANAAVAQAAAAVTIYFCFVTGNWVTK